MIPLTLKFLPLPKIALRSLPKKSVTPSTKKDSPPPQKKVCLIKKGGWKIIPDERKTNHTGMKNRPGWKNPKKNECKKYSKKLKHKQSILNYHIRIQLRIKL